MTDERRSCSISLSSGSVSQCSKGFFLGIIMNAYFGTVVTTAVLASSTIAGSASAATAYELRHAAQLLKERFQNEYFANAATETERAAAGSKTLIHVLAQVLAVNDACGLGLNQARVEDAALRLGVDGQIGRDFFADVREQIAEVRGDEVEADPAATCSDVRALYEAAAPLVELELARAARPSDASNPAAATSEPEEATGFSDMIVTAMLSGTCERLVVFGTNFSDHCDSRIVQSVYNNGRAGFTLAIGDKGARRLSAASRESSRTPIASCRASTRLSSPLASRRCRPM